MNLSRILPLRELSRRTAVLVPIYLVVTLCAWTPEATRQPATEGKAMPKLIHPGTIKIVTISTKATKVVPYESVPPRQRFVMLNSNGVETHDIADATEAIPIVEVHVLNLDSKGDLVPPENAASMRILEFGPEGRLLRGTTMTKRR